MVQVAAELRTQRLAASKAKQELRKDEWLMRENVAEAKEELTSTSHDEGPCGKNRTVPLF